MNGTQFSNYYLNSSRVGKQEDLNYFYSAWRAVYGPCFNDATPWVNSDPKFRVPGIVPKIKTRMLSIGCSATDADRVLKAFKKWYKDTYE